jgi:hypothetical protein
MDFVFADDSAIDTLALEIIRKLFALETVFVSNESRLEDFTDFDDIPGHKLIRLVDVPEDDRGLYEEELNHSYDYRNFVWYPRIGVEESKKIGELIRFDLLTRLEEIYRVPMSGFVGSLFVAKVAAYILRKKLEQLAG